MPFARTTAGTLTVVCSSLALHACGGSKPGAGAAADHPAGAAGKYTSVVNPELTIELKSGGVLVLKAAGTGKSSTSKAVAGKLSDWLQDQKGSGRNS